MNILLHQRTIPDYRVSLFNYLKDEFGSIFFFVGNKRKKDTVKEADIKFNENFIKIRNYYGFKNKFYISSFFIKLILINPKIVILEYSLTNLNIYTYFFFRPILKYKIILWSHGWNRVKGFNPAESLIDKVRIYFMRKADALLVYAQSSKRILQDYVGSDKIFVTNNTIDTKKALKCYEILVKEGRENVKRRLGFNHKHNLIFVGRMIKEKEPERLLNYFVEVKKVLPDIALHYIGEGPMREVLVNIVERMKIEDVCFYDAIYNEEKIGAYIYSSDLMIVPGYLGLVINHAFCFECPVLSQLNGKDWSHAPEIDYLTNGKNGFLVAYNNDYQAVSVVIEYLKDECLQKQMRKNAIDTIKESALIENMINAFRDVINYCELTK